MPRSLRVTAAVGWRLLVVAAALWVIGQVVAYLSQIVVPVAIALLLAALLAPTVHRLVSWRMPRAFATLLVVVGALAVLGLLLTFVVQTIAGGVPALAGNLATSVDKIITWLTDGPLHLSPQQLTGIQDQVVHTLQVNQASITQGVVTTAATVGEVLTEFLLVVFTLIFFLYGGETIWSFLVRGVPSHVRSRVDVAGRRGLAALVHYVRATAVVAAVDAVGIGIGLAILRVPLAMPLAMLVFLGAFVPIIGAVATGGVSVLVALVAQGPVAALIVLGIITGVMQLESHVLQPLLLGRAVRLHPLAVVLAIAVGLVVGGIAGALLAVPLLAVVNAGVRSLTSAADASVDPAQVHTSQPARSADDLPEDERVPDQTG